MKEWVQQNPREGSPGFRCERKMAWPHWRPSVGLVGTINMGQALCWIFHIDYFWQSLDINTAIILMRKLRLREIKALTRVTWWMMVGFYALPHFSDQKTLLSITTFHLCLHHLQWCLSLIFTSDILFFHPSISVLPSSYNFRPAECGVEAGKFLPPHLHTYFTFWHTSSFKSSSAPSKNISMSGPATEYGLRLQH